MHSSFRPQILTRRQVANTCGIGDAPEMLLRTAPHERAPPALRSGSPRPFPSAGHREIVHEMRCRSASTPIGLPRIPLDSSGSISLLRLLVGAGRMADDFRDLSQPRASSRCRELDGSQLDGKLSRQPFVSGVTVGDVGTVYLVPVHRDGCGGVRLHNRLGS